MDCSGVTEASKLVCIGVDEQQSNTEHEGEEETESNTQTSASSLESSPRKTRNHRQLNSSSPFPSNTPTQPIESGEEDEFTIFNCKCKLYSYAKESKEWKERGVGQLKVNMRNPSDTILSDPLHSDYSSSAYHYRTGQSQTSRQVRLLIRHAIVKKVILNCNIRTGIYEYRVTGDSGNSLWLICADSEGISGTGSSAEPIKPATFLIRMPTAADCQAVYDLIQNEKEQAEHEDETSNEHDNSGYSDSSNSGYSESEQEESDESDDRNSENDESGDGSDATNSDPSSHDISSQRDEEESEHGEDEGENEQEEDEDENDSLTDADSDAESVADTHNNAHAEDQSLIDSASSDNIQIQQDELNTNDSSHFNPIQLSPQQEQDSEQEEEERTSSYEYGSDDIEQSLKSSTFNETSSDHFYASHSGLGSRSYSCYPCLQQDFNADICIPLPSVPWSSIPIVEEQEEDQQNDGLYRGNGNSAFLLVSSDFPCADDSIISLGCDAAPEEKDGALSPVVTEQNACTLELEHQGIPSIMNQENTMDNNPTMDSHAESEKSLQKHSISKDSSNDHLTSNQADCQTIA